MLYQFLAFNLPALSNVKERGSLHYFYYMRKHFVIIYKNPVNRIIC